MSERVCQRPGCSRAIPSRKRKDARWCSRSCESKARRAAARQAAFEEANPDAPELLGEGAQSLAELRQRADRPAHWQELGAGRLDGDLAEHSDVYNLAHEIEFDHQDEEAGIYADTNPGRHDVYDPDKACHERMQVTQAIDRIWAEYESLLHPYQAALRRNPGVKPAAMARLEQKRDARIAELSREHHLAEAYRMAERDRPGRIASAYERQLERAAARSFAMDLGRGRHLRDDPADAGRATDDIARW